MAVSLMEKDIDTPPPRGIALPFVVTKKIVTDPGIIYTAADAFLFATTNVVGFMACLAAVGVAAALKAVDVAKPDFLKKYPKIAEIAYDDRTPLRSGALALMIVGGAAVATGAWLPAAAGFLLAGANFAMAESISRQDHTKPHAANTPAKKEKPKMLSLLFKRPDLYLNLGFACAGLMAGGASLFILPLVGIAFSVGMNNVIKGKPEHMGHPKMITSMAAMAFAGIGFASGHGLIAAAHLVNALVIAEFERRVTPGGNMLTVVKESFATLGRFVGLGKLGLIKDHTHDHDHAPSKPAPLPDPVHHNPVIHSQNEAQPRLSRISLKRFFKDNAEVKMPATEPMQLQEPVTLRVPANTNESVETAPVDMRPRPASRVHEKYRDFSPYA